MLDEALELLPRAALQRIVGRYISLDDVTADAEGPQVSEYECDEFQAIDRGWG